MGNERTDKYRAVSAIMGLVVGDALGVPVEFESRESLKDNPVMDMMGYGTYNQPPGTWSDDSSMTVATLEWYAENKGDEPDYKSLMDKFSEWLLYGAYTPYGQRFDCGISTSRAIMDYGRGTEPLKCGCVTEYENGNGSLMRILPGAIWHRNDLVGNKVDKVQYIYELSMLTHAHARSQVGCFIYSKLIADMMRMSSDDKLTIVKKSLHNAKEYLDTESDLVKKAEAETYNRLWDIEQFKDLPEEEIKSSGYIVDTLEAAIWCFLNTESYKECVLKAVNLGSDTDTVGAVAGGLAGLYYGLDDIPEAWLNQIPKKDWIIELTEKMTRFAY